MKRFIYIFTLLTALYSCSGVEQTTPAMLTVLLEDSPAEFEAVNIKIENVSLFNGSEWLTLANQKNQINILTYTGGKAFELVKQNIPEGDYSKIRFIFSATGNTLRVGKENHELTIEEQKQSVELPLTLHFGAYNEYVFCDMDVAASINEANYTMSPKLEIIDTQVAGAISGVISTPAGKGIAELMYAKAVSSGGVVKSTFVNAETGRLFIRLNEGEYNLYIEPRITSLYKPDTLYGVMVQKAEATKLGAIKLKLKLDGKQ